MRLDLLLARLPSARIVRGAADREVMSVEIDSRRVRPGTLFCCVPGMITDGHDYVDAAARAGAIGIVTEHDVVADGADALAEVRVPSGTMRSVVAELSSAVHGRPAERLTMVGVTGTNGKTTVAHLVGELLAAGDLATAVIGTLSGARTTPPAPELHEVLETVADLASALGQRGAVSMEVSSHALDQERVAGICFDVAIFTNLSHDHLDYHGTMEAYFAAKKRLFEPVASKQCVIWGESEAGQALVASRPDASRSVGWADADGLVVSAQGSTFLWRGAPVSIPLIGRLNVANALLAAEAAVAVGLAPSIVAATLNEVAPVPGRMERIVGPASAPTVLVDYAHTPDALRFVLEEARRLVGPGGRVLVVFGCGGDRDQAKRPLMGRLASELADVVLVTTDNPRSEDPDAIAAAVVAGARGATNISVEPDRAEAIAQIITQGTEHDVVVVAGKGHEATQEFADRTITFDDRSFVADILAGQSRGSSDLC